MKKPNPHTSDKFKRFLISTFRYIIVFGIAFYIIYPLLLKSLYMFMDEQNIYDVTVVMIPKIFTLDNVKLVMEEMNYTVSLINTLVFSAFIALLQTIFCCFVGYGFARFEFPLKKFWFAMVMLTLLIPPQVIIAPLYMKFRFFDLYGFFSVFLPKSGMNLINTAWPFVISAVTCMGLRNGLFIYIIRQFFRGIPKELEEAAHIDGANHASTYFRIMLPNAKSLAITITLFAFVWQYIDIFYTSWFMPNADLLSVKLNSLSINILSHMIAGGTSTISDAYSNLLDATGSMLVIFPILIIYFVLQKQFTESIERSGIVG